MAVVTGVVSAVEAGGSWPSSPLIFVERASLKLACIESHCHHGVGNSFVSRSGESFASQQGLQTGTLPPSSLLYRCQYWVVLALGKDLGNTSTRRWEKMSVVWYASLWTFDFLKNAERTWIAVLDFLKSAERTSTAEEDKAVFFIKS
ncbi:UNVERIFIED_CONTAM: hypothetical protein K2H54_000106 [Gekko kuhli]